MNRSELFSRIVVILAIVGAIGIPFVIWQRTPLVHAQVAENGGWTPEVLHAEVGKPLDLHFTSDDVVHGFAVGQMDMLSVDIMPGKVTEVTLTFGSPGIYTFFCTRWCGLNHWRMRGTIEVKGDSISSEPASPPLYVSLNLDIDAPHEAPSVPIYKPIAGSGQQLIAQLPLTTYQSSDYYRTHSPYQLFDELDESLSESQRWDVVAYVWRSNTTSESLANGQELYTHNCAACHGGNGAGDGVFADELKAAGDASQQNMSGIDHMSMREPADFTDPMRMLGASPALLQGKLLRGGMGTGMPMWGSIFTEDQIWDLIAYIYSFQFEYQGGS